MVGFSTNSTPQMHAFLWNGGMTDLGAFGDGASYAYAISDTGQVAGWGKVGTYPNITEHAFRWNGSMQDLGTGSWAQSSARHQRQRGRGGPSDQRRNRHRLACRPVAERRRVSRPGRNP
ncbi:MAG: hypothetical protein HZY76_00760 [Anaerolineae bacterium]|nr:MAG: hypothetical protein HZY76_00760 [Anaerolineae bacterium]